MCCFLGRQVYGLLLKDSMYKLAITGVSGDPMEMPSLWSQKQPLYRKYVVVSTCLMNAMV
jgi:hypothetical protein